MYTYITCLQLLSRIAIVSFMIYTVTSATILYFYMYNTYTQFALDWNSRQHAELLNLHCLALPHLDWEMMA